MPTCWWILLSGFFSAAVGVVFGLPSLRIKGFYLAIATLAAQFFLVWCFDAHGPWLYNYNASGAIEVPTSQMFGVTADRAVARRARRATISCCPSSSLMTFLAINIIRGPHRPAYG